jgi:hypothetical protein
MDGIFLIYVLAVLMGIMLSGLFEGNTNQIDVKE